MPGSYEAASGDSYTLILCALCNGWVAVFSTSFIFYMVARYIPPVLTPVVCAVLTRSFTPHSYTLAMTHSLAQVWADWLPITQTAVGEKTQRGQIFLVSVNQVEHVIKHFQVGGLDSWLITVIDCYVLRANSMCGTVQNEEETGPQGPSI